MSNLVLLLTFIVPVSVLLTANYREFDIDYQFWGTRVAFFAVVISTFYGGFRYGLLSALLNAFGFGLLSNAPGFGQTVSVMALHFVVLSFISFLMDRFRRRFLPNHFQTRRKH